MKPTTLLGVTPSAVNVLLIALPLLACSGTATQERGRDGGSAAEAERMGAPEILGRTLRRYAACGWYRDLGTVVSVVDGGGEVSRSDASFTTYLERPGTFRFTHGGTHFDEPVNCRIELADDRVTVRVHGRVESLESLDVALSQYNGLCDGAPCLVPMLLFPGASLLGTRLSALGRLERLEDEVLGRVQCYRLRGAEALPKFLEGMPEEQIVTVWIGKEDLLIRQVREEAESDLVRLSSLHTYEPEMGAKLLEPEDAAR